jgi:hypothetical protein
MNDPPADGEEIRNADDRTPTASEGTVAAPSRNSHER